MDRPILDILDYFSGHMGGWHMGQTVRTTPMGYSMVKMKIKTYVQIQLVTSCRKKMNKSELGILKMRCSDKYLDPSVS
jgi:hypothetical protein